MKLAFTSRQLNADLLAGVLNQAFIKSDVVKRDQGTDRVIFSINGMKCEIKRVNLPLTWGWV